MDLEIGQVFIWHDFPFIRDGLSEEKNRWFIYLGRGSTLDTPLYIYMITPTSQDKFYKSGGTRYNNNYIEIKAGIGGLLKDSYIDFTMNFYSDIPKSSFDTFDSFLEKQKKLPQDQSVRIYNKILVDKHIIRKIKKNIYESYIREKIIVKCP